ncbi:MAG: hypothetical protein V1921_06565 [Candidatus Altiarchaeota archaeon]
MSETKIVKLKLEDLGAGEKLPDLRQNPVETALRIYEKTEIPPVSRPDERQLIEANRYHAAFIEQTRDLDTTPEHLRELLRKLEAQHGDDEHFRHKAAVLLTVLMQHSSAEKFEIKPKKRLDFFGLMLNADKEITVDGNVGNNLGHAMNDGKIIVKGNALKGTGSSKKGGYILVEGDTGEDTGEDERGGNIKVIGRRDNPYLK